MIRAVLVGVDAYERPDVPDLSGCVNDVALVRWVLRACYGVPNADIRVLVNQRATKARIMERLDAVLAATAPGDVALLYFSGHGSQLRDRDGDELVDHLDEVLCPHDMDWDRGTYVLDDDLAAALLPLPSGAVFEAFLDCCFWGESQELAGPGSPAERRDVRYLPPPVDLAARFEGEAAGLVPHRLSDPGRRRPDSVVWAASLEGQPAAEDHLDGRANGLFTYWSCRLIAEAVQRGEGWGYTRERLRAELGATFRAQGYAQAPQLATSPALRDRPPFTA